jgi:hypothetical protein
MAACVNHSSLLSDGELRRPRVDHRRHRRQWRTQRHIVDIRQCRQAPHEDGRLHLLYFDAGLCEHTRVERRQQRGRHAVRIPRMYVILSLLSLPMYIPLLSWSSRARLVRRASGSHRVAVCAARRGRYCCRRESNRRGESPPPGRPTHIHERHAKDVARDSTRRSGAARTRTRARRGIQLWRSGIDAQTSAVQRVSGTTTNEGRGMQTIARARKRGAQRIDYRADVLNASAWCLSFLSLQTAHGVERSRCE